MLHRGVGGMMSAGLVGVNNPLVSASRTSPHPDAMASPLLPGNLLTEKHTNVVPTPLRIYLLANDLSVSFVVE